MTAHTRDDTTRNDDDHANSGEDNNDNTRKVKAAQRGGTAGNGDIATKRYNTSSSIDKMPHIPSRHQCEEALNMKGQVLAKMGTQ